MPAESDTYTTAGDDRTLDTVCDRIVDLAQQLVDDDADVEARRRRDVVLSGFPPRASGTPTAGGATNRMHDFATGEDGASDHAELIPQHADPVGEAVVADAHTDDLGAARRRAYRHACAAMRELEAASSALAQTRPPVVMDPEDRDICWPCRDVGVKTSAVYRDSSAGGAGQVRPRCRRHYDWALTHNGVDASGPVSQALAEGRRVTTKLVEQAQVEAARAAQRVRNRSKKRRR